MEYWNPSDMLPAVTGHVIEYIRSSQFVVNGYASYMEVPNQEGLFRRDYPWTEPDAALVESRAMMTASQAMTNRANRLARLLTNPENWNGRAATAVSLNGNSGFWNQATKKTRTIKKSLMMAMENIPAKEHVKLVISIKASTRMLATSEIQDYCKQSGLDGDRMPDNLYGLTVCVEDTPFINLYDDFRHDMKYCWPEDTAVLVTRIGGIETVYEEQNASTCQVHYYGPQMMVAKKNDTDYQNTECFVEKMVSESGFMISDCFC